MLEIINVPKMKQFLKAKLFSNPIDVVTDTLRHALTGSLALSAKSPLFLDGF